MLENDEELESLRAMLDQSYSSAGEHLKSIQLENLRFTVAEVVDHFQGACICDVATVSASGRPLVAPMDMFLIHGLFFFNTGPGSVRLRHIRENPWVSVARTVGAEVSILVQGKAELIDTNDYDFLYGACMDNYGPDYPSWGLWDKPWFLVRPSKLFASRLPS